MDTRLKWYFNKYLWFVGFIRSFSYKILPYLKVHCLFHHYKQYLFLILTIVTK